MTDAEEPATSLPPPAHDRTDASSAPSDGPRRPPDDDLQRPLDEGRPADAPVTLAEGRVESVDQAETQAETAEGETADGAGSPGGPGAVEPGAEEPTAPLRPAVPVAAATAIPAGPAPSRSRRWAAATVPLARVATGRLTRAVHRLRLLPGRGARAFGAWSRRPSGRLAIPGALITVTLAGAVTAGALVVPVAGVTSGTGPTFSPDPATPTGSPTPTGPPGPVPPIITPDVTLPGSPSDALRDWAQEISARTGVPVPALLAYGYAELVLANTTPECNLRWTTLAAIGRVESNHGSTGDSSLASDGRALPPITGEPLDGEGSRLLIPDTDGGALDDDTEYDRAVGPMQFIPETWRVEAVDATGDDVADVHNIHDAALAAANYLCRGGRDLSTATDWWAAVHSYNDVSAYADAVFAAANEYGRRSEQA